jgi:hypothetical protein
MGGLVAPLTTRYYVWSNIESGLGRCDHILLPRDNEKSNALVIEYKIAHTEEHMDAIAQKALDQINNLEYDTKLKDPFHVDKITKIALVFCGKKATLKYQLDCDVCNVFNPKQQGLISRKRKMDT